MTGTFLPEGLLSGPRRINLYYLHELFRHIAQLVRERLREQFHTDIPLAAGMWGGSYLVADELGVSRTNVVRLYSIVSIPQDTPLDDPEAFDQFNRIYQEIAQASFKRYSLDFHDPRWGEAVPYTNRQRPTTALQMWDASGRVHYMRVFFVRNRATWAESIIYDALRNIKVLKELLNLDRRPPKKEPQELKFLLQDVLITYFTLRPILHPDFEEHAQPIIQDLFDHFIKGLHDPEAIEAHYHRVYANALVYGYEQALEGPYQEEGLDIQRVEDWPAERINFVPESIKSILAPALEAKFNWFRKNLRRKTGAFAGGKEADDSDEFEENPA